MYIAARIKHLREMKNLSQGHIEQRTGLLRCYVSRVENGHTVPSVETLEKFARALEVPLWSLLYEGEEPPELPDHPNGQRDWASAGRGARLFSKFRSALSRATESDRQLLLTFAFKMVRDTKKRKPEAA
jgi:transcriptional regulator with XRE-family HTH domain